MLWSSVKKHWVNVLCFLGTLKWWFCQFGDFNGSRLGDQKLNS